MRSLTYENGARTRGFTMLELIIVVTCIAVILAILLPAINMAREMARRSHCAENLRQVAELFLARSARNPGRPYCSGAWLPEYDGDPTKVGWVADLYESAYSAKLLLCPTNQAEKNQILDIPKLSKAFDLGRLPSSIPDNEPTTLTDFRDKLVENGLNTNYVQAWYFARTDMLSPSRRAGDDPDDTLDPKNCIGPLKERDLGAIPSHRILLLADAAPSGMEAPPFAMSVTKGPTDPSQSDSELDFEALGLIHGASKRKTCNLLFLDGHVRQVADANYNGQFDAEELEPEMHIKGLKSETRRYPQP